MSTHTHTPSTVVDIIAFLFFIFCYISYYIVCVFTSTHSRSHKVFRTWRMTVDAIVRFSLFNSRVYPWYPLYPMLIPQRSSVQLVGDILVLRTVCWTVHSYCNWTMCVPSCTVPFLIKRYWTTSAYMYCNCSESTVIHLLENLYISLYIYTVTRYVIFFWILIYEFLVYFDFDFWIVKNLCKIWRSAHEHKCYHIVHIIGRSAHEHISASLLKICI